MGTFSMLIAYSSNFVFSVCLCRGYFCRGYFKTRTDVNFINATPAIEWEKLMVSSVLF